MLLTAQAEEQAEQASVDRSVLLRFVLRQLPAAGLEEVCRAQLGTAAINPDAIEAFELQQIDVAATLAVAAEHAAAATAVHANVAAAAAAAAHADVPHALTSAATTLP